jgi:hypothetical protein
MTVRWLSDDCQMTVRWLSDDCQMTVRWLWDNCQMTVRWLWDDFSLLQAWWILDEFIVGKMTTFSCTTISKYQKCSLASDQLIFITHGRHTQYQHYKEPRLCTGLYLTIHKIEYLFQTRVVLLIYPHMAKMTRFLEKTLLRPNIW